MIVSSSAEQFGRGLVGTKEVVLPEGQRVRALADTVPVMIWSAGRDKRCDFFNRSWLDFRGRTMEQEIGFGWSQGVHPEDLARCMRERDLGVDRRQKFSN